MKGLNFGNAQATQATTKGEKAMNYTYDECLSQLKSKAGHVALVMARLYNLGVIDETTVCHVSYDAITFEADNGDTATIHVFNNKLDIYGDEAERVKHV